MSDLWATQIGGAAAQALLQICKARGCQGDYRPGATSGSWVTGLYVMPDSDSSRETVSEGTTDYADESFVVPVQTNFPPDKTMPGGGIRAGAIFRYPTSTGERFEIRRATIDPFQGIVRLECGRHGVSSTGDHVEIDGLS